MLAPMICLPQPDAAIIARKAGILAGLRAILDAEDVIDDELLLRAYETDALTAYRQRPLAVVLPHTTEQVAAVLRYADQEGIPIVPRGAGVTNLAISQAVEAAGFYYAPDPSSQIACTIGGNVAENSGGVHCLKYGLTTNNLLGVEIVTIDGEVIRIGGKHLDAEGYDLLGIMTGSEGAARRRHRSHRAHPAQAADRARGADRVCRTEDAGNCVAAIIGAGIIPGGMEMMDRPAIHAAEAYAKAGYPLDVEALLIVELDGPAAEVDHLLAIVERLAKENRAVSLKISRDDAERLAFWAGRKAAFPAVGRISPDYYCMDGTIPRGRLAEVLREISALSEHHGLRVANVFHAGDGNLHPLILYDANQPGEIERAEEFGADISSSVSRSAAC
jgi:glycolate oxidase